MSDQQAMDWYAGYSKGAAAAKALRIGDLFLGAWGTLQASYPQHATTGAWGRGWTEGYLTALNSTHKRIFCDETNHIIRL